LLLLLLLLQQNSLHSHLGRRNMLQSNKWSAIPITIVMMA
jgi:hypothetical protein